MLGLSPAERSQEQAKASWWVQWEARLELALVLSMASGEGLRQAGQPCCISQASLLDAGSNVGVRKEAPPPGALQLLRWMQKGEPDTVTVARDVLHQPPSSPMQGPWAGSCQAGCPPVLTYQGKALPVGAGDRGEGSGGDRKTGSL